MCKSGTNWNPGQWRIRQSPVITGQVHHEETGLSSSQRGDLWIGVLIIWPMARPTGVVGTPAVPGCGGEQHPPTQPRAD